MTDVELVCDRIKSGEFDKYYKHYETLVSLKKGKVAGVYFILNTATGLIKIGMSTDLSSRISILKRDIENISGGECKVDRIIMCSPSEAQILEKQMHDFYGKYRKQGEWFELREYTDEYLNDCKWSIDSGITYVDICYKYIGNMSLYDELKKSIENQKAFSKMFALGEKDVVKQGIKNSIVNKMLEYMKKNSIGFLSNKLVKIENGQFFYEGIGKQGEELLSLDDIFEGCFGILINDLSDLGVIKPDKTILS